MKGIINSSRFKMLIVLFAGFLFTATSTAFAEEKVADDAKKEVATDSDKKTDGDKKKKKGKDGEEPECE